MSAQAPANGPAGANAAPRSTVAHVHAGHVASLTEGISKNVALLAASLAARGTPTRLLAATTPLAALNRRRKLAAAALESRQLVEQASADGATRLVHMHVGLAATAGLVRNAKTHPDVPVLLHVWNPVLELPSRPAAVPTMDWLGHRAFNTRRAALAGSSWARHVVVSSRYQERQLWRMRHPGAIHVVPNGVDTQGLRPAGPAEAESARRRLGVTGDPVILYYGHVSSWKGVGVLLDAMPAVLKAQPRAQLLLATTEYGRGPQWLKAQLARNGLERCTVLHGASHVPDLLAAADIAVLPALAAVGTASFPNVLLECLAAGVPTIATRVGCVPEAIEANRNGVLVRPGDPAGLADALRTLADDAVQRRRLGAEARRTAEQRFAWADVARRMQAVYAQVLDEPVPAPVAPDPAILSRPEATT